MIRRVTGIGSVYSRKRSFIFTNIYSRALVKRDRDTMTQEQRSSTLISTNLAESVLPEDKVTDSSTFGKKSTPTFFLGVKESETEIVSTSSLTPTK